jgi:hypothetical protein
MGVLVVSAAVLTSEVLFGEGLVGGELGRWELTIGRRVHEVEVGRDLDDAVSAEAALEKLGRVLVVVLHTLPSELAFDGCGVFGEELCGLGDVTFSPFDVVELCEILGEVGRGVPGVSDLAEVNDRGASEFGPFVSDDGLGKERRSDEEVIVGKAALVEFRDAEVLDRSVALAERFHQVANLAAGFVEGVSGVGVEFRVDGECEESVGFGVSNHGLEAGDFDAAAVGARPGFTREYVEHTGAKLHYPGEVGLGFGTDVEVSPVVMEPGGDELLFVGLLCGLVWHLVRCFYTGCAKFPT